MSERSGKVLRFNPVNRQGEIQPSDGGPPAMFYLPAVTNADPLPKANDLVTFEAPEVRKNKKGKPVQGNATSVTITERAPEPPPGPPPRTEQRGERHGDRRDGRGRRTSERRSGDGRSARRDEGARRDRGRERRGPDSRGSGEQRATERREQTGSRPERTPRAGRGEKTNARAQSTRREEPRTAPFRFPLAADLPVAVTQSRTFHPGLLLDKYFVWPLPKREGEKKGESTASSEVPQPRSEWGLRDKHQEFFLRKVFEPAYRQYQTHVIPWKFLRHRWERGVEQHRALGSAVGRVRLTTVSRLAVNLHGVSLLTHAGVVLDHTWGYPYIPGGTIKGLLGEHRDDSLRDVHDTLFGQSERAGLVTFFDALPTRRPTRIDIDLYQSMTPHYFHGDAPPSTNQDPEVRHYLALPEGTEFEFAFAVARPDGVELGGDIQRRLTDALVRALAETGLGARRNVGYGRFARIITSPKQNSKRSNPADEPEVRENADGQVSATSELNEQDSTSLT